MPATETQAVEAAIPGASCGPAPSVASVPRYAWHLAFLLAEQFGTDAATAYATDRCVEMAVEGDDEDRYVWGVTLRAVRELQRTMRALGEGLH